MATYYNNEQPNAAITECQSFAQNELEVILQDQQFLPPEMKITLN